MSVRVEHVVHAVLSESLRAQETSTTLYVVYRVEKARLKVLLATTDYD